MVEDNVPVHKKVCIPIRQKLEMTCYQHPPNSLDLNPIEYIWAYIKHLSQARIFSYHFKERYKTDCAKDLK